MVSFMVEKLRSLGILKTIKQIIDQIEIEHIETIFCRELKAIRKDKEKLSLIIQTRESNDIVNKGKDVLGDLFMMVDITETLLQQNVRKNNSQLLSALNVLKNEFKKIFQNLNANLKQKEVQIQANITEHIDNVLYCVQFVILNTDQKMSFLCQQTLQYLYELFEIENSYQVLKTIQELYYQSFASNDSVDLSVLIDNILNKNCDAEFILNTNSIINFLKYQSKENIKIQSRVIKSFADRITKININDNQQQIYLLTKAFYWLTNSLEITNDYQLKLLQQSLQILQQIQNTLKDLKLILKINIFLFQTQTVNDLNTIFEFINALFQNQLLLQQSQLIVNTKSQKQKQKHKLFEGNQSKEQIDITLLQNEQKNSLFIFLIKQLKSLLKDNLNTNEYLNEQIQSFILNIFQQTFSFVKLQKEIKQKLISLIEVYLLVSQKNTNNQFILKLQDFIQYNQIHSKLIDKFIQQQLSYLQVRQQTNVEEINLNESIQYQQTSTLTQIELQKELPKNFTFQNIEVIQEQNQQIQQEENESAENVLNL